MSQLTLDNVSDGCGLVVCKCGSRNVRIVDAPGPNPKRVVHCLGCGVQLKYEVTRRRGRVRIETTDISHD